MMTVTHRRRMAARTHTRAATQRAQTTAPRIPLNQMTPDEIRTWIQATRRALEQKQARERAYLDRRAGLGTLTPTDDACAKGHPLEEDLLAILDELEARR
jgi:hypothetical protein